MQADQTPRPEPYTDEELSSLLDYPRKYRVDKDWPEMMWLNNVQRDKRLRATIESDRTKLSTAIEALNEIDLLSTCRCDVHYTGRDMHSPSCPDEIHEIAHAALNPPSTTTDE